MHSMSPVFAELALQPYLPVTSILAVVVGMLLLFGRNAPGVVTRWLRSTAIRRTPSQGTRRPHFRPDDRIADVGLSPPEPEDVEVASSR
jgi:hypothetical protein